MIRVNGLRIALFLFIISGILLMACAKEKETKRVLVVAHRGASGLAPENTLASFKKAMEIGADYSELDVHQSKDGQVVVMHDETLDRTTNGSGGIWEYTVDELKKLDAGSWFSAEFAGEPIPTLSEVIDLVKGKMKLNIEIKISGHEPDIAQKVVEIIRAKDFSKDCMITSFDMATVKKVKEIAPDLVTGFIFARDYPEEVFSGNWEVLSVNKKEVDEAFMAKAKKADKQVHVWTVNKKENMKRLIDLGVDGIITNYPNILKELLNELN